MEQLRTELSILIPVYNSVCLTLVDDIRQQALSAGIKFEIIVADDGSNNEETVSSNQAIDAWENCRYIFRSQNVGRAAIRNFLAEEARYAWLLFMDSHMAVISPQFLLQHLSSEGDVIYGGYAVREGELSSLRFQYEKACGSHHCADERRKRPYQHFHTCNFLVRRDVMLANPFDERFRHYGYEDILFGKRLKLGGISITHTDNQLGFNTFESNEQFLRKTEESLETLYQFRNELHGYSQMLTFAEGIHLPPIRWAIQVWHRLFRRLERHNLCSNHPSLMLFRLYKIGYFFTLNNKHLET